MIEVAIGHMKRKISRQQAIYSIALAGISSAVALLMVWLGVIVRFSTVAFFIAAGIALYVPLSQRYYLSSIFAYFVSAGLSLLIAGDIFSVMGYVIYFGPMAILTGILLNFKHKIKWYFALIIKIVYINIALALLYFVCNTIMIDSSVIEKLDYWVIAIVGTILLVAIDYVLQFVYTRLGTIVGKSLRKISKSQPSQNLPADDDDAPSGENPFDEFESLNEFNDSDDDDNNSSP